MDATIDFKGKVPKRKKLYFFVKILHNKTHPILVLDLITFYISGGKRRRFDMLYYNITNLESSCANITNKKRQTSIYRNISLSSE